jgi:hypothetical protein
MSFQTVLAEDRRLCILRLLSGSPGKETNHYVMKTALQSLGHAVSHDVVKGDFAWLESQGLVATADHNDVTVATLRAYGQDVADGVATVPGVKRPMPGE